MKNLFSRCVGRLSMCAVLPMVLAIALLNTDNALPSATWPNEPAGFGTMTDIGFNSYTEGGWALIFQSPDGSPCGQSTCIPVADGTAPLSPSNVMQQFRDPSQPSGGKFFWQSTSFSEVYVGAYAKMSDPFTGYSNLHNKMFYFRNTNFSSVPWLILTGPQGGPFNPTIYLTFSDPATGSDYVVNTQLAAEGNTGTAVMVSPNRQWVTATLGVWHRFEVYMKASTCNTCADGIVKWWMDGVLSGEYYTVNTPMRDWSSFSIDPSWDAADTSWVPSWRMWDHIHISAAGVGGSTPPPAPTGLSVK